MNGLAERIADVRKRVASAAIRSGRNPAGVSILYATKNATAGQIAALYSIEPHLIIGENRVRDAQEKFSELRSLVSPTAFSRIEKHMVGTLQSNKVRDAVRLFDCIQSVDSEKLARKINSCAAEAGKTVPVYLEVNNGEESKHGIPFAELGGLVAAVRTMVSLRLVGLMGMGIEGDEKATREFFRKLRKAADGFGLKTSMGMSDDFEVAVEEGSDMVRMGRAVFRK